MPEADVDDARQDSATLPLFEKDEGPGSVGVEWFHTKEYLRDLGQDDLVPTAEKQRLRHYYRQQENVLHAKLAFFEKKENVEKLTKLSGPQDLEAFAKAQIELRAATSYLSRLCRDSQAWDAMETEARKWRLTRKWAEAQQNDFAKQIRAQQIFAMHFNSCSFQAALQCRRLLSLAPDAMLENCASGGME